MVYWLLQLTPITQTFIGNRKSFELLEVPVIEGNIIEEHQRPPCGAHTYRTHAFIFVRSSSSVVIMARGRVYTYDEDDDKNLAQHGAHTGQLLHCTHLCNLKLEIHFMVN